MAGGMLVLLSTWPCALIYSYKTEVASEGSAPVGFIIGERGRGRGDGGGFEQTIYKPTNCSQDIASIPAS